jgi:enoyl-CoA hydratase/carnithine racemase
MCVTSQVVSYETDDKVGIVTLNRPDKLNAINKDLKKELTEAFARADDDASTHVVVLRAAGRAFCVGYDIGGGAPVGEENRHVAHKWHAQLTGSVKFELIPWYMRKPVIASVQGHVLGAGCELAMLCDLTIAADNALFGEPEIHFSVSGPSMVMPWIIGFKKARELLYTGDMIDAKQALDLGMVNHVVPAAELEAATMKFARRVALISPEALAMTKLAINRGADASGFRNAMEAGVDVLSQLYAAQTEVGSRFQEIKRSEGLGAALKWRRGQFNDLA